MQVLHQNIMNSLWNDYFSILQVPLCIMHSTRGTFYKIRWQYFSSSTQASVSFCINIKTEGRSKTLTCGTGARSRTLLRLSDGSRLCPSSWYGRRNAEGGGARMATAYGWQRRRDSSPHAHRWAGAEACPPGKRSPVQAAHPKPGQVPLKWDVDLFIWIIQCN